MRETTMQTTKDARRATRMVCGGQKALSWLKTRVHRRNRRAVRVELAKGNEDFQEARVTGWDVA